MRVRLSLGEIEKRELIAGLEALVRGGNQLTADLLEHLAEIERRMIHLELGFSSLHGYCVHGLRMSEGAAGRRVIAARVCRTFPDALDLVAGGQLHLSALCSMSEHLTPENASELFGACSGKARRHVEEILAARFPKRDLQEQVRRLSPRNHELEALAPGRFGVQFTADSELKELIERARALASHRLPGANLASLMKVVFTSFVEQEEKKRFAVGAKQSPRKKKVTATPPGGVKLPRSVGSSRRGRYLAAAVRREVFERDGGRCTFVSEDGRRCEETMFLQFDHIEPRARRRLDTTKNLRLRCAGHNQLHARNCFGSIAVRERAHEYKRQESWADALAISERGVMMNEVRAMESG